MEKSCLSCGWFGTDERADSCLCWTVCKNGSQWKGIEKEGMHDIRASLGQLVAEYYLGLVRENRELELENGKLRDSVAKLGEMLTGIRTRALHREEKTIGPSCSTCAKEECAASGNAEDPIGKCWELHPRYKIPPDFKGPPQEWWYGDLGYIRGFEDACCAFMNVRRELWDGVKSDRHWMIWVKEAIEHMEKIGRMEWRKK